MIYINLLPWREYRLKQRRLQFFIQVMAVICLSLVVCVAVGFHHGRIVQDKLVEMDKLKLENQQLIDEMQNFQIRKQSYQRQQTTIERVNHFVDSRRAIPDLLLFLQKQKPAFDIIHLLINQHTFKLKVVDSSPVSALSLLNKLRNQFNFCQVRFIPDDSRDLSEQILFELEATFCNEKGD